MIAVAGVVVVPVIHALDGATAAAAAAVVVATLVLCAFGAAAVVTRSGAVTRSGRRGRVFAIAGVVIVVARTGRRPVDVITARRILTSIVVVSRSGRCAGRVPRIATAAAAVTAASTDFDAVRGAVRVQTSAGDF